MTTRDQVRQFIVANFFVADAQAMSDDASLLEAGVVDSTGVLELIAFVEREFGIKVDDDEVVPENLDGVARVASFVDRKRSAREAAHTPRG